MLHPQSLGAIALWSQGPSVTDPGYGPAEIARERAAARAEADTEPQEQVGVAVELEADGVPCRLYSPAGVTGARPGIVFSHGGGFVFGDRHTHDAQARRLANRTGASVLSVDYRRPPEHPFPAAPHDLDRVTRWMVEHAAERDIDPHRLVALGDSAGGNLALVSALRNRGAYAAVVLVYPFIDPAMAWPSYRAEDNGALTAGEARWYWEQYADGHDLSDPDLAPIESPLLGTLPPTLVIAAEHDLLRDEDAELARRIREAGAEVRLTTYAGMVHGFWRHPELFDAAEESLSEIAAFLTESLHAPPPRI